MNGAGKTGCIDIESTGETQDFLLGDDSFTDGTVRGAPEKRVVVDHLIHVSGVFQNPRQSPDDHLVVFAQFDPIFPDIDAAPDDGRYLFRLWFRFDDASHDEDNREEPENDGENDRFRRGCLKTG